MSLDVQFVQIASFGTASDYIFFRGGGIKDVYDSIKI